MRRTKEDAQITRSGLLDAALRVFSRKGYADTRLEDIAAEAGVTRGALYHHFGGKVEIYEALLAERFGLANQRLEQLVAEGGSPLQVLRRVMVGLLVYLEENEDYRQVQELTLFKTAFVPELEQGMREKVETQRSMVAFTAGLVKEGISQKELRPDLDCEETALSLLSFLNGAAMLWLMDPHGFSLGKHAAGMVDMILSGIVLRE